VVVISLLLQSADTVHVMASRDGLALAADLAVVILAILLLVMLSVILWMLLMLRRGMLELRKRLRRVSTDPLVERVRGLAENMEALSGTLRREADVLTRAVNGVSERLNMASDRMEERIEDFNALLEVVQEEAEDLFVDTASTVRGVRAGSRHLRGDDPPAGPAPSPLPRILGEEESTPRPLSGAATPSHPE